MKNKYVKLITFVALVAILFLQGWWLNNTYKLLEIDFKKNISNLFVLSIEKEAFLRMEDPVRKGKREGQTIEGVHPLNDHYTNNRFFQDWLYKDDDPLPISLEKVDSFFKEEIKNHFKHLDYSFSICDSLGNQTGFFKSGKKNISGRYVYKETIKLRNIDPEYITLVISSPHKVVFEKMLLILIGSLALAIIVLYGLVLQIRTIVRQDRIAELRQDFTHAMIHDIKNPVTTILMGIGLLKSGKIDDKQEMKEKYYSIIKQESEHIQKLADKILEIAKFEGQRVTLSKEQVNLSDLLESLKEKYTIITTKKILFQIDLNGVENIYADLYYIQEAFGNLIDNAIKYSKEKEDVEIYITSSNRDNTTQIIFKDSGIGISAKDQKIIFQKFERSLSVIKNPNKVSGFGLGLNFVYQVVHAHGGTIKVNSRLNSYSEFTINLPDHDENDKTIID